MFLVPPKYVARALAEFKALDPEVLDRGMWQACRVINLIPDVATLFSCASHPELEDNYFYVTLIASSTAGERNIEQLYKNWCTLLGTHLPEEAGSTPTHQHTSLLVNRLEDPYAADEVIWARQLTTLTDVDFNTPLKVTQYLQLAANRLAVV